MYVSLWWCHVYKKMLICNIGIFHMKFVDWIISWTVKHCCKFLAYSLALWVKWGVIWTTNMYKNMCKLVLFCWFALGSHILSVSPVLLFIVVFVFLWTVRITFGFQKTGRHVMTQMKSSQCICCCCHPADFRAVSVECTDGRPFDLSYQETHRCNK